MWLLCQPSQKNWVFGFFRLGQTLGSEFGACWDRGLGLGLHNEYILPLSINKKKGIRYFSNVSIFRFLWKISTIFTKCSRDSVPGKHKCRNNRKPYYLTFSFHISCRFKLRVLLSRGGAMFSWDIQNANDHIKCIKSYCFIAVQYPPSSVPSVHCFYVNVSIKLTEREDKNWQNKIFLSLRGKNISTPLPLSIIANMIVYRKLNSIFSWAKSLRK